MPPSKKKQTKPQSGKQTSLASTGMYPQLGKMSIHGHRLVLCLVPGDFWVCCPDSDKQKKYKCTVTEFIAMHTFSGGRKQGAGIKCKEIW